MTYGYATHLVSSVVPDGSNISCELHTDRGRAIGLDDGQNPCILDVRWGRREEGVRRSG